MAPKVSVCIPTYNGASHLRECLDSVLNQTFKDLEIVVADDCSTDETQHILFGYAARDSRIRMACNELNLGLVGNWNRCIDLAHGEWIKFVFQDDFIAPECIERLLASTGSLTEIVACKRNFLFEDGVSENIKEFYAKNQKSIDEFYSGHVSITAEQYRERVLDMPGANFLGEPTVVMLKRSLFERFGTFEPELVMSCDLEYWTRVAIHTGVTYVREPLATFRVHHGATSEINRTIRRFRMNYLDDLVILDRMVHSPCYIPLRQAAANRCPPVSLDDKLEACAHAAKEFAERAILDDDPIPFNEWEKFVDRYPYLSGMRIKSPVSNHLPVLQNFKRLFYRMVTRHYLDKLKQL